MNLLNLSSKNHTKLYCHNEDFINIINLYNHKKLPSKFLLSGSKGIGKATFAYHLINYIFSQNDDCKYDLKNFEINPDSSSYKFILNNTHPNLYLIDLLDEKKTIEISQIREMLKYANKSSFNNKEKIILIDNVENLNLNSLNALLKIVEEPNENTFFILVFDNSKKISKTLFSRCSKFNLHLSFDKSKNVFSQIVKKDINELINQELINYYNTPADFINLYRFSLLTKINILDLDLKNFLTLLINDKSYKKHSFIKNNIYKFIEFYFHKLIKLNKSDKFIYNFYHYFFRKINNLKKFNLDEESLFIELKAKILNE